MKRFTLAVGALIASFAASASDGNDLYKWALDYKKDNNAPSEAFYAGRYTGYISGINEAFANQFICLPVNTRNRQLFDIVYMRLRDNPKERTDDAGLIVLRALSEAYPCKNNK